MFVAMTAVINARRRLKRKHAVDVMLVPAWITENTVSTLGRESKFLRFNIIRCALGVLVVGVFGAWARGVGARGSA